MRDAVSAKLGAKTYSLLPTYGVLSDFEDRFGSIAAHYAALADMTARLAARSYLVYLALQAWRNEHPDEKRVGEFDHEAVAKSLFDRGLWHEDTVKFEIELIERLLYTPEQYQEKKDQRAAAQKAQAEIMASLNGLNTSAVSPLPI